MIKLKLISLLFSISICTYGQVINSVVSTKSEHQFVCSYKCNLTIEELKKNCDLTTSFQADTIVKEGNINPYEEFDSIITKLKKEDDSSFKLIYKFKECEYICNAASVVIDSVKYILYNKDFLNNLSSDNENLKWIVRSIIGHEIGHHILDHTSPSKNKVNRRLRRKRELRADYFSAFVIKQFEESTEENALAGLNSFNIDEYFPKNDEQAKKSNYPTLKRRKVAVKQGYNDYQDGEIRLSMFNNIKKIAEEAVKRWGKSIILREIDEELSYGNLIKANEKIEELLKTNLKPQERESVQKLQLILNGNNESINAKIESSEINQEDIDILKDLYNKHKDLDKKQTEVLLKTIKKMEEVKIKDN